MIITGPNTGGKTATLKALGLAVLAAKCGLAIPAAPPAKLPCFDFVLADIGGGVLALLPSLAWEWGSLGWRWQSIAGMHCRRSQNRVPAGRRQPAGITLHTFNAHGDNRTHGTC